MLRELELINLICRGVDPVTGGALNTPHDPKVATARNYLQRQLAILNFYNGKSSDDPNRDVEHPNIGKTWTAADNEKLKRLNDAGYPISSLAKSLGRTENSIQIQLDKIKSNPRFANLPTPTTPSSAFQRGKYTQLAKERAAASAAAAAARLQLPEPNSGLKWSRRQLSMLKGMWAAGDTLEDIGIALGRTPSGLASRLIKEGVHIRHYDIHEENIRRGGVFGKDKIERHLENEKKHTP